LFDYRPTVSRRSAGLAAAGHPDGFLGRWGRTVQDLSFVDGFGRLTRNIEGFVHGNGEAVRLALICLFAEGHLLIEGVPGVAKTSLAKAVARSIAADGKRIQFTPDLLPSDVTGGRVWRQDSGTFRFEPGPVFTNILLADEINRSSPRTQSALLEVMAERQVTVDGTTYGVAQPFMCIATQNPIEHRGTFPLPEAQIDRFMMKVTMKPPARSAELLVIDGGLKRRTPETAVEPVLTLGEVARMIAEVREVHVTVAVMEYILDIVEATRTQSADIEAGASPRAGIALALAAQAHAKSRGRDFVCGDDVKAVARPVLRHRLLLSRAAARDPDVIITSLIEAIPAPGHDAAAREDKQRPSEPAPTPVAPREPVREA
jgi:MoxR-like ATPase